jgi:thiol-disulfide isomerase/thioredoxin
MKNLFVALLLGGLTFPVWAASPVAEVQNAPAREAYFFTASWCPSCKPMRPVAEALAKAHPEAFSLIWVDMSTPATQAKAKADLIARKRAHIWEEYWRRTGRVVITNGEGKVLSTFSDEAKPEVWRSHLGLP